MIRGFNYDLCRNCKALKVLWLVIKEHYIFSVRRKAFEMVRSWPFWCDWMMKMWKTTLLRKSHVEITNCSNWITSTQRNICCHFEKLIFTKSHTRRTLTTWYWLNGMKCIDRLHLFTVTNAHQFDCRKGNNHIVAEFYSIYAVEQTHLNHEQRQCRTMSQQHQHHTETHRLNKHRIFNWNTTIINDSI